MLLPTQTLAMTSMASSGRADLLRDLLTSEQGQIAGHIGGYQVVKERPWWLARCIRPSVQTGCKNGWP